MFSAIFRIYINPAVRCIFTYFFREKEGEVLQQWMDIKTAASEAMTAHGGTITHHHGAGQDHSPQYFEQNTIASRCTERMRRSGPFDPPYFLTGANLARLPSLEQRYDGTLI